MRLDPSTVSALHLNLRRERAAETVSADLAAQFARAKPADVSEILKTLETFGRARKAGEGKFRT